MAGDDALWVALGFAVDQTYHAEEIIAHLREHRGLSLATGPETVAEGVIGLSLLHREDNSAAGRIYFARSEGTRYRVVPRL